MSLPANCACGRIPTIQSVDQHYPLTEKGKQIPLRKDYRVACRGCGCASPWRKMRESSQVAVLDWNAQMELTKDLSDAARLERFRSFLELGIPKSVWL